MIGNVEKARRELANLGNALTLAERGLPRHSPTDLTAWLLRVAGLHPTAVDDAMLLHVCDVVSGTAATDKDADDAEKLALVRMSWAAIVRAQFKKHGLTTVDGQGAVRARAA
jgi:hypothetical protein